MALAVKILATSQMAQPSWWKSGKVFHVLFQITPTATYLAGGDTLDLTQLFNTLSSAPGSLVPTFELPLMVRIDSQRLSAGTGNGFQFFYKFSPGTTLANGVMQVYTATSAAQTGLAEITGAPTAYPTNVLNDVIIGEAYFAQP